MVIPTEGEGPTPCPSSETPRPERALPLPATARRQPGRLVPVGRGGVRPGPPRTSPIFLSVGYSACHWCHVMAHESFEDPAVADRAQRRASSASRSTARSGPTSTPSTWRRCRPSPASGGWPMSVFLTPDRRPFYGGTYFPPTDHQGRPSFTTVLHALADIWDNRRAEVEEQADELAGAIAERSSDRGPARGRVAARRRRRRRAARPPHPGRRRAGRAGSTRSGAGSAARRSSPSRPWSTWPSASPCAWGRAATADRLRPPRHPDPRRHGRRRDPRPPGRRVRPLRHRHRVAGPALREDALRPGRTAPGLPPRLAGDRRPGLPGRGRGDRRLRHPRPDRARGRGLLGRGRRLRGGRGEVLRLDARPGRRRPSGRRRRSAARCRPVVRRHARRQLRGGDHPAPPGRRTRSAVRSSVEDGRRRLLADRSARVRPGLDDKVLTEWNAMYASALAEAAAAAGRTDWATAAVGIGEFLWDHLRDADGPVAAELAARRRCAAPRLRRRPRLAGRLLHPPGRADRPGGVDRAGRRHRRRPDRPVRRRRRAAGSSPPPTTPSS